MWTKDNIPDMKGKTVIVTGGNTGIGYETAKALYQAGAAVTIAARDLDKASLAMHRMLKEGGKGNLSILQCNLASLESVSLFTKAFMDGKDKLDLLINNAGVMVPPASLTDEGFELQFGVNFLAHFTLTSGLFPLLKKSPHSRIVTLSSGAATLAEGIDFSNLRLEKPYEQWREYAVSKLACILFTFELDRRIKNAGLDILSLAAHPGVTRTDLQRHIPSQQLEGMLQEFDQVMQPWQGALPTLYAAIDPKVKGGEFYGPDGEREFWGYPALSKHTSAAMKDTALAKKLWDYAQEISKAPFDFGR
jgi:NAD(P)-dependent dehydrogenase (short-subunit alcohol dehydrogenase family)